MLKARHAALLLSLIVLPFTHTFADSHSTPTVVVPPSEMETDPELIAAAMQFFVDLAKSGSDYSQLSLGESYLEGTLGQVDYIEAFAWLSTAHEQGITEAAPLIERAWQSMNDAERKAAQQLAIEYQQWISP
jgi:TPR repeat protein